ncbi:tRNA (adenosine(37)-N6)-threonylcarbamoyltransferase complex ATPase subunit type 1 TsaE [Falsigemmobacter faecalis]|uniref:tRNA threonylcarbamoyladenosine biosynthesis protein TsaE n=1 Tax=Falsigemmobacter faecalis TaxID=2488730 RepID=A0A3P3DUL7_9RHOB|nr:tRNA (adenosine(37)-N6)-threonylcarbamoyltransferase complex ATPase subunit type 1 TsaE [Falsigemmobacter faecalis]RRH77987.1 tRNA (adenosine(37)-N6)-threonylcarbamoyltransferase complex ATPase subunit type 1 TsaE [Falsigemmobacter faecalis]
MTLTPASLTLLLPDAAATTRLGAALSEVIGPGDVLLLDGPIGSGKTHLSRALIHAALAREGRFEDVPSPTFTLVQVYETAAFEIWHADLYRLGHPQEVIELGLDEAMQQAVCLIEWPDRLGDLTPPQALHLTWAAEGEGRRLTLTGPAGRLAALQNLPEIRTCLQP